MNIPEYWNFYKEAIAFYGAVMGHLQYILPKMQGFFLQFLGTDIEGEKFLYIRWSELFSRRERGLCNFSIFGNISFLQK